MKLTPLDIRHKEFKRGMRGYADVEVDEFLDEVADEYERLFKENIDLNERLETLEDKVKQYRRIEETLQKTLVSAQQSAEELKANATKEGQLILRDAELKARQMVSELYSDRQKLEKQVAGLRGVERDVRFRLRTMLETFLKQLEETPVIAGEAPAVPRDDFADRAQAIKEAIAREDTVIVPPEPPAAEAMPAAKREAAAAAPASDDVTRFADASAPRETVAPGGAVAADEGAPAGPGRVVVGEDDVLADVDTGVNEDEFKW